MDARGCTWRPERLVQCRVHGKNVVDRGDLEDAKDPGVRGNEHKRGPGCVRVSCDGREQAHGRRVEKRALREIDDEAEAGSERCDALLDRGGGRHVEITDDADHVHAVPHGHELYVKITRAAHCGRV